MVELLLDTLDLATVRFTISPVQELALAVRTVQHDPTGVHGPWVGDVRRAVARHPELDLAPLLALVPRDGILADILTPSGEELRPTLADELAAIRALEPEILRRDITLLRRFAGPTPAPVEAVRSTLADDPRHGLRRVVDSLEAFWELALAEHWPRVQRLLGDDIARRSVPLARGGLKSLMTELSPRVEMLSDRIRIEAWCFGDRPLDGGRGLRLVPSVFCQPRGLVALHEPFTPRLIYQAFGVGNLWTSGATDQAGGLDEVLGRTRAQLLRTTAVASTTSELANLLGLSPATVSEHLGALRRAGLVDSRRDGRLVLYVRTSLADELVRASAPGPLADSGP